MRIYLFFIVALFTSHLQAADRSFFIDYDRNTFVKDGKPFRYISGSIHPYRVPYQLWQDRLNKMWAAGLNAVQVYLFWNMHEKQPGVFDFDGQNNVFKFIEMANKTGFVVLLRPGPYACAERDYGGLPPWLLAEDLQALKPRTHEGIYMNAVRRYLQELMPRLNDYLYKNGGPIVIVQIENEYGSFYACDRTYTSELRELYRKYLGDDVILYTTDGGALDYLKCGAIPGVYPSVDFGPGSNITQAFQSQRAYAPKGPLINSEYYSGWLDWWGSPHAKVPTKDILKTFHEIMNYESSSNLNFYMFHGGTNFGFSNGANQPFFVQPTSYDYDSPISEAGDLTLKYFAIRDAISKYLPLPSVPMPKNSTKIAYGTIPMTYHVPLVDAVLELSDSCVESSTPLSFEKLGQANGFILYQTKLTTPNVNGRVLSIPKLHDRAYIQIGNSHVGVLYRMGDLSLKINLPDNRNDTLYIIVENMGRLNFGDDMLDAKGILEGVFLDGKELKNWTTCLTNNFIPDYQAKLPSTRPFVDLFSRYKTPENLLALKLKKNEIDFNLAAIYIGDFDAVDHDADTFLKMDDKFMKGFALVRSNDTISNLGRYWPNVGPQITLYTPSPFVSKSIRNSIALVEFEGSLCETECYVELIDYPLIDSIPSEYIKTFKRV